MSYEAEIPTQFAYSVKIEQSAKGARVTVHANSNEEMTAISEAIQMYTATKALLEDKGEVVAAIDIKSRDNGTYS
jgi:hypothetical protein